MAGLFSLFVQCFVFRKSAKKSGSAKGTRKASAKKKSTAAKVREFRFCPMNLRKKEFEP